MTSASTVGASYSVNNYLVDCCSTNWLNTYLFSQYADNVAPFQLQLQKTSTRVCLFNNSSYPVQYRKYMLKLKRDLPSSYTSVLSAILQIIPEGFTTTGTYAGLNNLSASSMNAQPFSDVCFGYDFSRYFKIVGSRKIHHWSPGTQKTFKMKRTWNKVVTKDLEGDTLSFEAKKGDMFMYLRFHGSICFNANETSQLNFNMTPYCINGYSETSVQVKYQNDATPTRTISSGLPLLRVNLLENSYPSRVMPCNVIDSTDISYCTGTAVNILTSAAFGNGLGATSSNPVHTTAS